MRLALPNIWYAPNPGPCFGPRRHHIPSAKWPGVPLKLNQTNGHSQASSASAFVDDIEREVTPRDLDAYIDALRRRVSESEGFAQQYWQLVLDHYLAVQASMPRIDEGEPKGLDKQVYQRIKTLKDIREQLSADDPQIANVIAILEAYRTKKLHIENGKVSCWSGGKQVTELEDLNWDTIASVASEHSAATQGDFWVEDPSPLATTPNFLFWGKDFFLLCLFPVDVFGQGRQFPGKGLLRQDKTHIRIQGGGKDEKWKQRWCKGLNS
ncbi:hypothetical protein VTN96DRAFT_4557 [Rasamsonia emersonii]